MRKLQRIVLWAVLVGVTPMIAGCANFDPDSLDIFGLNEKKKLPGQREDLFPGGVPGVTQGIPPEYMKGNQGAAEPDATLPTEPKTAAAAAPEKPKAKPKPKVRQAARPKTQSKPTRIDVAPATPAPTQPVEAQPAPAQAPAAQQPAASSGWPAPTQNAPSSSSSAWPAPQPSGTFQR
ncbi:MAG: hypothetical protein JSR72_00175 [Proteobacteria bacterium]|nr:hypothetical protein [Pseudomonadota bacterium]